MVIGFLQVAVGQPVEYERVVVVPLPLPPPTELGKVMAALEPCAKLNSRLVRAQMALWLQKISANDLQTLRASIPVVWSANPHAYQAQKLGLAEAISGALSTHPDLPISPENPLTTIEAGRVGGRNDFRAALASAAKIPDEKIRAQFLLGVVQTAGQASSYEEAQTARDALIPLLPRDVQHTLTAYQYDAWTYLWPAQSIAAWALTKPEEQRFGPLRHVLDHGAEFFATLEEATAFLPTLGRAAQGQSPLVAESMGKVLAARDPDAFIQWWLALPKDDRMFAIDDAIGPLLRRNPKLIDQIIPHLPTHSLGIYRKVTQEWFRYDPVAALQWCSQLPERPKNFDGLIGDYPVTDPIDVTVAVDLLNRFPEAKDKLQPLLDFDSRRQEPATFAQNLLRLSDPEVRRYELIRFGLRWGYWDGSAALAWAVKIDQKADSKTWVNAVLESWMRRSPEEALKAAMARPELTQEDVTRFKEGLPARLRVVSQQLANQEPARYARPNGERTVAFATGGETSAAAIVKLRHSLAELARPSEPAVSNIAIAAEVLSLGQVSTIALLEQFEINAPVDAKENALRILLLERWALTAPEPAARWIIGKGNGTHRAVLPLALATLSPSDPELAMTLALQIPDDGLLRLAQQSIVRALAMKSHQVACELGERYHCDITDIVRDWLRADAANAQAWLKRRLMLIY